MVSAPNPRFPALDPRLSAFDHQKPLKTLDKSVAIREIRVWYCVPEKCSKKVKKTFDTP